MLIFLVALFVSTGYAADKFPSKLITVIVPFALGGGTDMVLRPIIQVAQKYLGQPIVAEYRPGAGGVPALAEFAKVKPDGYTLIIVSTTGLLVTPRVQTLPYKFADFQAIAQMVEQPLYVAVKADSPWKTIDEFINTSKEAPASFKVGNPGVFSPQHLMVETLKANYGVNLTAVPFEGGTIPDCYAWWSYRCCNRLKNSVHAACGSGRSKITGMLK